MKTMTTKKLRKIENTKFYSKKMGVLAKGCRQCVKGEKLVLFVTGLCPRSCPYCPVSDQKNKHDVTFANEWPTDRISDIVVEARLCNSKGAGFTGGDPLVKINRTCKYIRALKKEFGNSFHIHLYTSFNLVTEEKLKQLYDAGLDEIRFHADLDDDSLWGRIDLANRFEWDVGVEIPVIPGKKQKTIRLLKFMDKKIKFVNLNELEVADNEASTISKSGMKTKDSLSYGVKGSELLAKELLEFIRKSDLSFSTHYCTAKLKDKVQLANRIKRRAKNSRKIYDEIDPDGMFVRGAIYFPFLVPSAETAEKLKSLTPSKRKLYIDKLRLFRKHLMQVHKVPKELLEIDTQRLRITTSAYVAHELADYIKGSGLKPALVTEYPTWDALIVELEWF